MTIKKKQTRPLLTAAILLALSGPGLAQEREFDLPEAPANVAIPSFAQQADLQIIAPAERLEGKTLPAIQGRHDTLAALQLLIAETGLEIIDHDGRTVTLAMPRENNGRDNDAHLEPRAQQTGNSPDPADTAPVNDDIADETPTIDTVIVTAQRRAQALEDVPIAMTVLDRDALDKTRGKTLADVQQIVPNFMFELGGFESLSIRGVGGGGRNIGFDTRAGMYLDGVYVGQAQSLRMPLFDIDQVEVLRGPQGHLFGRNTVSGAVNIITAAPSWNPEAGARAVIGNDSTYEFYGNATGPLGDNVLGKISFGYETRDGYTRNLVDGNDLDDLERISTRGQLRFMPTDRLTVDVYGDYSDSRENRIVGEPLTDFFDVPMEDNPYSFGPFNPREVAFATTPFTNVELWGGSVTANYDMASDLTLTSITGYRNIRQRRQNDADYNPFNFLNTNYDDDFTQFSQELRISSPDDTRLRYVAGVYYLNEDADSRRRANVGDAGDVLVPLPAGSPIPFAPPNAAFGLAAGTVVPIVANVTTDNYAAFGALDFDLTDRLTLNFGARFTREEKDLLFNLDGSASGGFQIGSLDNYRDSRSDDEFSPTIGLTYAISDVANIYAKYASGFKSGGWNIDFLDVNQVEAGFDFDTESVDSYEIGIKGSSRDRRVHYDLAVFYNEFDDFQIFRFVSLEGGTSAFQLTNAAKVETRGFEGSVRYQATDQLNLNVNLGHVDAEFTSFPGGGAGGADLSGNELPSPDLTGAFSFDYAMPIAAWSGYLEFYGEYSYRSNYFSGPENDPVRERIDSRDMVNARVTYVHDSGRYSVSAWARNLTDEDFVQRRARDFLGTQTFVRSEPRAFGLELSYWF